MEKYLRTKDEILTIRTNLNNQVFVVDSKGKWFEPEYIEKDIIDRASTIDSLVDYIVVDYGSFKHIVPNSKNTIENIIKNWFGCTICFILLFLMIPLFYIPKLIYWVFHI